MLPHKIINCVRLKCWDELSTLASSLPGWVYRGQRRASWSLASKLERSLSVPIESQIETHEVQLIREFQAAPAPYVGALPDADDWMSWCAIMQHYGHATRFLDFSESYEVAAYFALHDCAVRTDDPEDAAIWAVNTIILREMLENQLTLPDGSRLKFDNDFVGGGLFNFLLGRTIVTGRGAAVARSALENPRARAQRGLFVYPLNLRFTLEENLYSVYSLPAVDAQRHIAGGFWDGISAEHIIPKLQTSPVVKIILPFSGHAESRLVLRDRSVTERKLFPDVVAPAS